MANTRFPVRATHRSQLRLAVKEPPAPDYPGEPLPAARAARTSIEVVKTAAELERFADALTELSHHCSEPNIFYEPWMLLPAIKAFGSKTSFTFLLVFLECRRNDRRLCGFFPLETQSSIRGVPLPIARLWSYLHFHWCPPLIRAGHEAPCFDAFLAWVGSKDHSRILIELGWLPARGILAQSLKESIARYRFQSYVRDRGARALLSRTEDVAAQKPALPASRLKELNRLRRRLGETGKLVFERLTDQSALPDWIEGFLGLEAKGWKGRNGTALACSREQKNFFTESADSAFRRGQLGMLRLRLDERAIAYKVNFSSGRGSFAFKIAYDEDYARFSPGVLLELDNIRHFHASPGPDWMDSCANSDHFMANRLWSSRRRLASTWIAAPGWRGNVSLRLLAGLDRVRARSQPAAATLSPGGQNECIRSQ